jgi:hypothetical protein
MEIEIEDKINNITTGYSLNEITSFYTHPFSQPNEIITKNEATFDCKSYCLFIFFFQFNNFFKY